MKKINLITPVINSIVFAVDNNNPTVWCTGMNWDGEKYEEFAVIVESDDFHRDILFMSKDDGSFNDDVIETFNSWEDARECFEKFYK